MSSQNSESEGPNPADSLPATKKPKLAPEADLNLSNLPLTPTYERSFMHRTTVTHVVASRSSDFFVTCSSDGHVKFWKRMPVTSAEPVQFVKHFRAHLHAVDACAIDSSGEKLVTSSIMDGSLKVFDVLGFDMINILPLEMKIDLLCFVSKASDIRLLVAACEQGGSVVHIIDVNTGAAKSALLKSIDNRHFSPITALVYNAKLDLVCSSDDKGIIEVWAGPGSDYEMKNITGLSFSSKLDTDFFDCVKCKTTVVSMAFSNDWSLLATLDSDAIIRVFQIKSGRIILRIDESISTQNRYQAETDAIQSMEFGRRVAFEGELKTSDEERPNYRRQTIVFDSSDRFLLYPTLFGIKVYSIERREVCSIIGIAENKRFISFGLLQGPPIDQTRAAVTIESEAATAGEDPSAKTKLLRPILVTSACKKNRLYVFTRYTCKDADERDVFNEKPSKDDLLAINAKASTAGDKLEMQQRASGLTPARLCTKAVINTSLGDVHVKLFPKECPKSVENFCTHARNKYYNGHIFHRVIKGFMIQTGDPTGTGQGGTSIWGGDFEDEISPKLRHDAPFTLSMANAGKHTNGSQFFITVIPTPWLDDKHTVFGRVTKGMDVAVRISQAKTDKRTDKPREDISILSITVS